MNISRSLIVIVVLVMLTACQTTPSPYDKVQYGPAFSGEFSQRPQPAAATDQSEASLIAAGYAKLGTMLVWDYSGETTPKLLKEAAKEGADKVRLESSNRQSQREIGRRAECARTVPVDNISTQCYYPCGSCSQVCRDVHVRTQSCVEYTYTDAVMRDVVESRGELWRHDSELATRSPDLVPRLPDLSTGIEKKKSAAEEAAESLREKNSATVSTLAAANFLLPAGVATDAEGDLYVADYGNHIIRRITVSGTVTTFAGEVGQIGTVDGARTTARFNYPLGLAVDLAENIYISDSENQTIRKISASGIVTTLAGSPGQVGTGDGVGISARFNMPAGIATDAAGNIYVADSGNATIRKITPSGTVTTLAGAAGQTGATDGPGAAARFGHPSGIATDAQGNLYVADSHNRTVRKITPSGAVTTLAGASGQTGADDGTGQLARFQSPDGIATDTAGNIYVVDSGNATIRKITAAGTVTTLAGVAGKKGADDGIGFRARFSYPDGIATDRFGNVYVTDGKANTIRKIVQP